jgi:hypothetical protein
MAQTGHIPLMPRRSAREIIDVVGLPKNLVCGNRGKPLKL